ncbi:MAG TPA: biotin/lipoyl-binding protein, partial [Chthoniobacterales bacterium]|nr:biotin/lipoyl-binding protein [Chthoniobacterales bacterium]
METDQSPPASAEKPATAAGSVKPSAKAPSKRRRILILAAIAVVALLLFFGVPQIIQAFNTVSTDDAYVNGYVTFVAPRVSGQVARVLVDDNNRVTKGDELVELDPEPYQ